MYGCYRVPFGNTTPNLQNEPARRAIFLSYTTPYVQAWVFCGGASRSARRLRLRHHWF